MKKIIAVLLVLIMAISLCACDSADYKEATELFDSGNYRAARAIFAELGDYEDSAQMVKECDYRQAVDYIEKEDYAAARELLLSLGDYKDSADLLMTTNWSLLIAYVEEQDQLLKTEGKGTGTLISVQDGTLCLAYAMNYSVLGMESSIGIAMDPETCTAVVYGEESVDSGVAWYEAEATATWDFATYVNGDILDWETFDIVGITAYGSSYTRDLSMLNLMLTTALKETTIHLEEVLNESGLGLTMADLGFAAY